jgi:hypothetical protein
VPTDFHDVGSAFRLHWKLFLYSSTTSTRHPLIQKESSLASEGTPESFSHNVTLTEDEMSNGGKAGKSSSCKYSLTRA